ncbi:putative uridine nucleosidase 2 [Micractinium conductrix]|uniref:Uridine nucleosidase 2 n=1 Tax=Micractinium conductrix TaxID=554055 RepID=A0A2P6VD31_9CHLO|nr:putative uridine nucleosidase 2 [Micractinium conductrix]|eukprot:PSC71961.1 putative uridine nucleosidase 2 [Micractinium conductrix]
MAPIKLIIDTDPGVDDSMAILAAFNSPEVEIVGLTSIYGNVPTSMATRNAITLCALAGRVDVPVVEGSHKSLRGAAKERIADFVHGSDGFGNTNPQLAEGEPAPGSAAEFIVQQASKHPGEVVVLALAALTNVALALHLDPTLPEKLNRVVVLGGAFQVNGNVNPAAEANIFGDPDAANVVFSKLPNCWVVGLDVTHQCLMTTEQINGMAGRGAHGTFLRDITQFYLDYHRGVYGMEAVYMHDATALAAVVRPDLFEWHAGAVLVVADGPAKGRTIRDEGKKRWVGANEWQGLPAVKVALGVRGSEVVEWVLDRMTR